MPHYVNIAWGCFARGMALQLFVKHLTVCRIAGLYNVLQTGKARAKHQKGTARGAAHKNAGAIERFLGAAWVLVCKMGQAFDNLLR
jgi:hypothetical protein